MRDSFEMWAKANLFKPDLTWIEDDEFYEDLEIDLLWDGWKACAEHSLLIEACLDSFGGVLACSPDLYEAKLQSIAIAVGRELNDSLREQVASVLKTFPCSLD